MSTTPAIRTGSVRERGAFAAAVSRTIRSTVMTPLPSGTARGREGVRVTAGWHMATCTVSVDLSAPSYAARVRDAIEAALTGAGYTVSRNPHDALILTVER